MEHNITSRGARGLIPLDNNEARRVYNQGLERAAGFLDATARDYTHAAAQAVSDEAEAREAESLRPGTGWHAARANEFHRRQREALAKAELLQGQAKHIREMKVSE